MRYCDWDEVLDRDGLLILTGGGADASQAEPGTPEAAGRPRAACAGLVLGLMNYRGRGRRGGELCRYFAGIGATADDKAELWVLEEPVTWTEGDWTYEADATLRSGVLELETHHEQPFTCGQLPSPVELRLGPARRRGAAAQCRPHHHSLQRGGCRGGERLPPLPPGAGLSDHCIHPPSLYDGRPAAGGLRPPCQRSGRPGGSVLPPTGAGGDAPPRYRRLGRSPRGI